MSSITNYDEVKIKSFDRFTLNLCRHLLRPDPKGPGEDRMWRLEPATLPYTVEVGNDVIDLSTVLEKISEHVFHECDVSTRDQELFIQCKLTHCYGSKEPVAVFWVVGLVHLGCVTVAKNGMAVEGALVQLLLHAKELMKG